ncbi:hypothetical protein F5Y17DRAFT_349367 [Xylariaceae sp. FL0594]|nr:hypothetical protein F5Y17DRAFT_349367 [Xylariaceae sp. FL0594]
MIGPMETLACVLGSCPAWDVNLLERLGCLLHLKREVEEGGGIPCRLRYNSESRIYNWMRVPLGNRTPTASEVERTKRSRAVGLVYFSSLLRRYNRLGSWPEDPWTFRENIRESYCKLTLCGNAGDAHLYKRDWVLASFEASYHLRCTTVPLATTSAGKVVHTRIQIKARGRQTLLFASQHQQTTWPLHINMWTNRRAQQMPYLQEVPPVGTENVSRRSDERERILSPGQVLTSKM